MPRRGGERRSGQDGFLVPKVSFALRCRVGDRAEAGMSISPTPHERRELLPLLAQVLPGVTAAVNRFTTTRWMLHTGAGMLHSTNYG